jgi:hypothetical protein
VKAKQNKYERSSGINLEENDKRKNPWGMMRKMQKRRNSSLHHPPPKEQKP